MSRTHHHGDKAKQRRFGDNWWWYRSTPSYWNRLFHHKPRRQRERIQLHRVMRGEIDQVWDVGGRRPHIYFW